MGQGDVAEKAAPPATAGTAHGTSRVWGLGIDDGPLASRRWAQRGGRQGDDAGFPQGLGSLLRHVFASCLIPGLAGRVVDSTLPGPLIPPSGGVKGGPPGASRAGPGAVPIPAVAVPAEKEHVPTVGAGADHEAERIQHTSRVLREGMDTREGDVRVIEPGTG